MSSLSLALAQVRIEQRNFWRNHQAASFSFGFPIMIVLFLGGLFHDNGTAGVGGAPFKSYFVAGMVGVALMSATFVNLAVNLTFQRDQLILKRFRGTPLGAGPLFAGKLISGAVVALIEVLIILVLGRVAYGTPLPKDPAAFVVAVIAGIAVCSMTGVALSAFIANADSAPAVVNLPFLALLFVSGVFFTFQDMPAVLRYIGDVFPLRWLVEALRAAYLGLDYVHTREQRVLRVTSTDGVTFHRTFVLRAGPAHVHALGAVSSMGVAYLVIGAWFAVSAVVALRWFRWEPRGEG